MSSASTYLANNVLDATLRGVTYPLPSKVYISLHTADPTPAGGSEVSTAAWPSYVRKDAADGGAIATGFSAAAGGETKNAKQILFPGMDGESAVTVTHWAIYDAATAGNMLVFAPLDTPRTLQPGDVFVFDTNSLTVTQE